MKHLLVALPLLFAATTANASTTEWGPNQTNGFFITSVNYTSNFAHITVSKTGEPNLYLNIMHTNCYAFSSTSSQAGTIIVNGQHMQANMQCTGKNTANVFASTYKGEQYLINQFKSKHTVDINFGSWIAHYNAKGFTKAWNSMGAVL